MTVNWTFVGTNGGVDNLDAEIDYEFAAFETESQQTTDQGFEFTIYSIDVSAESGGDCAIRIRLNVGQVKGAWSNWGVTSLDVATTP